MTISTRNRSVRKTVLVVNNDVSVLTLMRGILQNCCRVLVAADVEGALSLLTINEMRIDLAIVDCNLRSSRGSCLQRLITEILPELPLLSMSGFVEDEMIRLKILGASKEQISSGFVQQVRAALITDTLRKATATRVERNQTPEQPPASPEVADVSTSKVMVAGLRLT